MRSVEPLNRNDHDRGAFNCGHSAINEFLQRNAAKQADLGISRTFVLIDDIQPPPRPIIGFFTFRPHEIGIGELPEELRSGYTRSIGAYLLAKLAVASDYRGKGVGTRLLLDVYRRVIALIDQGGGAGLFTEAKDADGVPFYVNRGFTPLATGSLKLFIPKRNIAEIVARTPRDTFEEQGLRPSQ